MRNDLIPYSHQWIDDADIQLVIKTLKGGWITQGPLITQFEEAIARFTGAKYAVALSSGTAALHAAYSIAGIGQGDEIITSPMTFLSTANAVLFLNARPVFVDVEKDTGNINPDLIEGAITPTTKAIVPVHYGGHPAHLAKIFKIAKKHNLSMIEDACHALGAYYRKQRIGSCQYSDMAVFSFHPVKSITTGEGGAVTTNSKEFYESLLMFRQHGVTKNHAKFLDPSPGEWRYEMQLLGYNYRITDFQCALGISQLRKLPRFIERRRQIAELYQRAFKNNYCFDLPKEESYARSSWHLYPIRLKNEGKLNREDFFYILRRNHIRLQVHYIPVYWQPYYQELGYKRGICPMAEDFYEREISIPLYPSMADEEVKHIIEVISSQIINTPERLHQYWRHPPEPNSPRLYLTSQDQRYHYLGNIIKKSKLIGKHIGPTARILEIGCNVGKALNELFRSGYTELTGVEVNEEAIALMRKTFPEMAERIKIHVSPIEEIIRDFQNNSFDIVFSIATLQHIHPDSEFVFSEMVRIAKKYIITIEAEGTGGNWRNFGRFYRPIFESLGTKQVYEDRLTKKGTLSRNYWIRVFLKEEISR